MAKFPMFCAKRQSNVLQTHSSRWSGSDSRLLNSEEKALPGCFGNKPERLHPLGVLQMCTSAMEFTKIKPFLPGFHQISIDPSFSTLESGFSHSTAWRGCPINFITFTARYRT
jgi:hypothetical protein